MTELPRIPDDVTLPGYGALPRFTRMINGVDWFVIGPDDAVRAGGMVCVARSEGTNAWVQVGQPVAERIVRHRAAVVRYVAARLDPFHSPENCAPCGGGFFVGDGQAPCACKCHGPSLVDQVFDGSVPSRHTYQGRVIQALRCLARAPLGCRKADVVKAVDEAARALAGADYDEFAASVEIMKIQREGRTP